MQTLPAFSSWINSTFDIISLQTRNMSELISKNVVIPQQCLLLFHTCDDEGAGQDPGGRMGWFALCAWIVIPIIKNNIKLAQPLYPHNLLFFNHQTQQQLNKQKANESANQTKGEVFPVAVFSLEKKEWRKSKKNQNWNWKSMNWNLEMKLRDWKLIKFCFSDSRFVHFYRTDKRSISQSQLLWCILFMVSVMVYASKMWGRGD